MLPQTVFIRLKDIDTVKKFVNIISKINCDFDFVSGRYVIDAKSIMGIFSLNLSNKLQLNIYSEDKSILEKINEFIVE